MAHEIEIAAADAVGGALGARGGHGHGPGPGARCANCGVELQGPWCHHCGQLWEDFHRSTLKLLGEAVEGLFHFDSRLWRTLPDLFLRPAKLTRSYLEGHRASQISPLRLFLVVLLAVFLAGGLSSREGEVVTVKTGGENQQVARASLKSLSPEVRAAAKDAIEKSKLHLMVNGRPLGEQPLGSWISPRIEKVLDDPERFKLILESWSERFAFLSLPLAAGLLALLFAFKRQFYFYDHIIFSLHSLSALGATVTVFELLNPFLPGLAKFLLFICPAHLFVHMRGVYGTSVLGALARMALLFMGSVIGAVILILGLLLVGLNGMGA